MGKTKCKVCFKYIEIYYFSRCLGIDKVPERGNNPLGMECNHFKSEKVDITQKKLKNIHLVSDNDQLADIESFCTSTPKSSKTISFRDDDHEDNESVHSVISIDYTRKSLQPLNPLQRKKCLENSGIDISKNEELSKNPKLLSKLREDRKQVGCKCSNVGRCDVNKCICSIEGVPCQSDGNKFPCKCGDKCSNASGKRIYSYVKIKFHYHHTLNRNMCLNEEVNIDALSTISGDCSICGNISDEVWKNYPETFHQTRASKRAGGKDFQNVKLFKKLMALDENFLPTNALSTVAESDGFGESAISCITFDSDKEQQCIDNDEQKTLDFDVNSNPINDNKISIAYDLYNFSPGNNIDKENINFSEVLIKKTKKNNSEMNSKHEFSFQSFSSKILFRCERPIKTNSSVAISNKTLSSSQEKFNSETVPFMFSSLDYYANDASDIHKSFIAFNSRVVLPLDIMNSPNAFKFNPILLTPDINFSIITKNSENKISINQNKLQILSNIRDIDLNIEKLERDYLRKVEDNTRSDTVHLYNSKFSTKSIESRSLFSIGHLMPKSSTKKVFNRSTNFKSKSGCSQLIKPKFLPSTSSGVISNIDNVLKTSNSFSSLKRMTSYDESPASIDHKNKNTRKKLIELNKWSECSNAIFSTNSILNQIPLKNKLFRYSDEITFFDIPYQTIDDDMALCEKDVD